MSSNAPIPDVAEVLIRSTVGTKDVELCLWFRCINPPITLPKLTTIANRVSLLWNINFSQQLGLHLFREVAARDRSPGSSAAVIIPSNIMRGLQGATAPASIALGLLNLTILGNTPHRSESYVYAMPEVKVNDGVIDSTYATQLLALWGTNNQSHGSFGWHHCTVSLFASGMARASGISDDVTHYQFAAKPLAAQRRRLLGRGSRGS